MLLLIIASLQGEDELSSEARDSPPAGVDRWLQPTYHTSRSCASSLCGSLMFVSLQHFFASFLWPNFFDPFLANILPSLDPFYAFSPHPLPSHSRWKAPIFSILVISRKAHEILKATVITFTHRWGFIEKIGGKGIVLKPYQYSLTGVISGWNCFIIRWLFNIICGIHPSDPRCVAARSLMTLVVAGSCRGATRWRIWSDSVFRTSCGLKCGSGWCRFSRLRFGRLTGAKFAAFELK